MLQPQILKVFCGGHQTRGLTCGFIRVCFSQINGVSHPGGEVL